MSWLPEVANPYVAALGGGFLYGLAFCTATCLPYVASYIAGINAGFRKGVAVTAIFNLGRITAYALIGAAIGALKLVADTSAASTFQKYSSLAFGAVSIAIGIMILFQKAPQCSGTCAAANLPQKTSTKWRDRFDFRAYTLGLSRGLILCPPLLALLAYAAAFAAPVDSFFLAVLFGVGTSLSPILVLGGATGWLLSKAPLFRKWISRVGAAALIIMGIVALVQAIII
jgi:thiol:disulfide interchange protein DsbD